MDLRSSRIRGGLRPPKRPPLPEPPMSPDRLIYMANQIGKFFQSQGHDKAVPGIADHIKKFWDPRMLKAIFAHLDSGGTGLDPNVRDALETLKKA
jgi:formate dehydrogenase subunit delta